MNIDMTDQQMAELLLQAYKHGQASAEEPKDEFCPYCGNCPHIGLFEKLTPKVSVGVDINKQNEVYIEASSNHDGGHFKVKVGWQYCPFCGKKLRI